MADDRPVTFEEFFRVRGNLLAAGKAAESDLDKWDDQLRPMTATAPETAAHIVATLATSRNSDDREIAAIYVGYLFATRREDAIDLLRNSFKTTILTSNAKRSAPSMK